MCCVQEIFIIHRLISEYLQISKTWKTGKCHHEFNLTTKTQYNDPYDPGERVPDSIITVTTIRPIAIYESSPSIMNQCIFLI